MSRDLHRPLRDPWIIDAVRTPIGRYGGALASVRPDDLAALVLRALVDRVGIDPGLIEDVILGCANQAGEDNRDVARMALLLADLPIEVGGLTVNRLCGSGLQAINSAAHAIQVGDGDVFIGGGVESMTRAPYVMAKPSHAYERGSHELQDTTLGWRFVNPRLAERHKLESMGETGENVAERWQVEPGAPGRLRPGQPPPGDRRDRGRPVRRPDRAGRDRRPARRRRRCWSVATSIPGPTRRWKRWPGSGRPSAAAARSPPATARGSTTAPARSCWSRPIEPARWASGRSPGSSRPRSPGSIRRSWASARCRPAGRPSSGPGSASPTSTWSSSTRPSPASRWPASTSSASIPDRVNVNGGAIALGHPLGMSGGRLITMLVHELVRTGGRYGLATMCIGVGQGIATVIERIDG